MTMVTIHTEDKLDLYIQLGNGSLLKYLEEKLVFYTEVKHIPHVLILRGALRPSFPAFLNHSLLFPYDVISFLSKVEIPSVLSSLMPSPAPPIHIALSCSSVVSGHHFPFKSTRLQVKSKS